jgi:hypothetical protein
MKRNIIVASLSAIVISVTFSACSTTQPQLTELQKELKIKEDIIAQQEQAVKAKENLISKKDEELQVKDAEVASLKEKLSSSAKETLSENSASTSSTNSTDSATIDHTSLVPPNAKTGECYAKVLIPAEYETIEHTELLKDKSQKIEVTKPTFKNVTYKILDKAESYKYVTIPATYKCVKNKVMVEPEKVTYKVIPATYKTVEEKVLVAPAHKYWKKGKGAITKMDNTTGEIMCLVEEPAKYKTIKKTVIDQEARTEKIVTPAKYKYIKAKVVDQEARTEKVIIPATYKTITVKELDKEAQIKKVDLDEKYQTYTETRMTKAPKLKWQRILCETNTNKNVIRNVQEALKREGYNPGPIDGIYGRATQRAIDAFQKDNGLSSGALTLETLDALGIN